MGKTDGTLSAYCRFNPYPNPSQRSFLMQVRRFFVIPVVFVLSALVFHQCDTVENPYDVPPVLEASSSQIVGTVGLPIDTFAVTVKNNVETQSFSVFPQLPSGLQFDAETGAIHGTPTETVVDQYNINAKNEHGNSEALTVTVRIAPATPPQPDVTKHSSGAVIGWTSVAGAVKYRLFRKDPGSDTAALLVETEDTAYVDTPLVSDFTYIYHVQAVGNGGTLSQTGSSLAFLVGGSGVESTKPEFDPRKDTTASEGESITVGISASDRDGDELTLTADQIPEGAEFTDNGDGENHGFRRNQFGGSGVHDHRGEGEQETGIHRFGKPDGRSGK
jgi:hypothetical protein